MMYSELREKKEATVQLTPINKRIMPARSGEHSPRGCPLGTASFCSSEVHGQLPITEERKEAFLVHGARDCGSLI